MNLRGWILKVYQEREGERGVKIHSPLHPTNPRREIVGGDTGQNIQACKCLG
jgi:hypothetical protein